jgi:transcriptional regulator with XRE-family HTH domain
LATLGERLSMLRRGKNLTQQELQQLSGVPYTTISRIETGRTDVVTSSTLQRLAHALDVTLDYLVGDSDFPRGCLGEKP